MKKRAKRRVTLNAGDEQLLNVLTDCMERFQKDLMECISPSEFADLRDTGRHIRELVLVSMADYMGVPIDAEIILKVQF